MRPALMAAAVRLVRPALLQAGVEEAVDAFHPVLALRASGWRLLELRPQPAQLGAGLLLFDLHGDGVLGHGSSRLWTAAREGRELRRPSLDAAPTAEPGACERASG